MTRREALILSAAFLGLMLVGLFAGAGLLAALGPDRLDPRAAIVLGQSLMLLLPALALRSVMRGAPLARPGLHPVGWLVLGVAVPISFVASGAAQMATIGALEAAGWSGLDAARQSVLDLYGLLLRFDSPASIVGTFLLASVVGPIIEEFAFRGVLQRLLVRAAGPSAGILGSALVFSALHFEVLGLAPRALIGAACGIAAHRSGSLIPSIAIHATFNAMTLCLVLAQGAPSALGVTSMPPSFVLPCFAVAIAGGLAGLGLIAVAPVRALPVEALPATDAPA